MEKIKARNVKVGNIILSANNNPVRVIETQYAQTCQSEPSVNIIVKDILTGNKQNIRYGAHADIQKLSVYEKNVSFSYIDDGVYYFLSSDDYEMIPVNKDKISEPLYLTENTAAYLLLSDDYDGILSVMFPPTIKLRVKETSPADKGGSKYAIMETGLRLIVPQYVQNNDLLEINTELCSFIKRH